jgi:hypothetical protein
VLGITLPRVKVPRPLTLTTAITHSSEAFQWLNEYTHNFPIKLNKILYSIASRYELLWGICSQCTVM